MIKAEGRAGGVEWWSDGVVGKLVGKTTLIYLD